MNLSPRRRRKLESSVRRICVHESGHATSNHFLCFGSEVAGLELARWKHGGLPQGWCYHSFKWNHIDTSSLWRQLDRMTCIVAGLAAEIVCGLLGDYDLEYQAATQVMTEADGGDLEKHLHLSAALWKRSKAYRAIVQDREHAEHGITCAVRFLAPHRATIEKLASSLEEKFWSSPDGYGVLLGDDIERIIGSAPSGGSGIEAAICRNTLPEVM